MAEPCCGATATIPMRHAMRSLNVAVACAMAAGEALRQLNGFRWSDAEEPPPRVVTHEGYVRHSTSIVAPTAYELYDPASGNAINYLLSSTTNLDISRYSGLQIVVTGEEGMHERWADTPVITVQKIYVLSTNKPVSDNKRAVSPHAKGN